MSKLDRIGKVSAPASAKKSSKLTATVTDEIKASVDSIIQLKARIKADSAALGEKESGVIDHVRAQQDERAFAGQFSKSFEVPGNTGALTYVTSDRFSVPQGEEELSALRQLLGTAKYAELFEEKTSLTIKPAILADETRLDQFLTACEQAGVGDLDAIFERVVKVQAKDALDEKQYSLGVAKLPPFRTLVRQNKPALK
jgi:hypothetical protein